MVNILINFLCSAFWYIKGFYRWYLNFRLPSIEKYLSPCFMVTYYYRITFYGKWPWLISINIPWDAPHLQW